MFGDRYKKKAEIFGDLALFMTQMPLWIRDAKALSSRLSENNVIFRAPTTLTSKKRRAMSTEMAQITA